MHYAIIGNSAAAVGAVEAIRQYDKEGPITIVADEPHHVYSRPLISYLLGGLVDESRMSYRPAHFYDRHNVQTMLGVQVVGLDTEQRTLTLTGGGTVPYDRLLISTGGTPIVPPLPGADVPGIFTFTTWDDARRIARYIEDYRVESALVVGGGLIGLKSMEALGERGLDVTVVELASRMLSATFDQTASDIAQHHLAERGVEVRCGTTVSSISSGDGRVTGVALRDGSSVPCGLVIFAIGVVPDTSIVAGTEIATDRGILVDDTMQTNVPGIHAAGDVAQATERLSGEKRPLPIFPVAFRQGVVAGSHMAGGAPPYEGGLAMNSVDVFGLPTISVGITSPEGDEHELLSARDDAEPSYRKIVLRDNRIVGAIFIGRIDRAGIITGLIREGIEVTGFKDLLLTDEFGLISLPTEYRKHVVSGMGIEV